MKTEAVGENLRFMSNYLKLVHHVTDINSPLLGQGQSKNTNSSNPETKLKAMKLNFLTHKGDESSNIKNVSNKHDSTMNNSILEKDIFNQDLMKKFNNSANINANLKNKFNNFYQQTINSLAIKDRDLEKTNFDILLKKGGNKLNQYVVNNFDNKKRSESSQKGQILKDEIYKLLNSKTRAGKNLKELLNERVYSGRRNSGSAKKIDSFEKHLKNLLNTKSKEQKSTIDTTDPIEKISKMKLHIDKVLGKAEPPSVKDLRNETIANISSIKATPNSEFLKTAKNSFNSITKLDSEKPKIFNIKENKANLDNIDDEWVITCQSQRSASPNKKTENSILFRLEFMNIGNAKKTTIDKEKDESFFNPKETNKFNNLRQEKSHQRTKSLAMD
jgi:hypothetical protein